MNKWIKVYRVCVCVCVHVLLCNIRILYCNIRILYEKYKLNWINTHVGMHQNTHAHTHILGYDYTHKHTQPRTQSWYIISFFRQPTRKALNQAVYNVVNNYAVVGVLEQLADFYWTLEQLMPQFFKGILSVYNDSKSPCLCAYMYVCICQFM